MTFLESVSHKQTTVSFAADFCLASTAMAGIEASILDKATDWLAKELEPSNSSMDTITIPAGPTTEDPFFRDAFFHPSLIPDSEPCKAILHYHLGSTNLRVSI